MNFLWDIVLKAQEQGMKEETLFFRQAKEYSPFFEQSFACMNEKEVASDTIELNLLYRFADIFQDLLSPDSMGLDEDEYKDFRDYFVDAVLHSILFTDLRQGLSKRELYIRKILEELRNGVFWTGTVEPFGKLEYQKQNRLAVLLLSQMETGTSLFIFRRAVGIFFPEALLYQIKKEPKKLLLYLKDRKTDEGEGSVRLAKDLFLPLGFELQVFWRYHFGIIGIDDTMILDEIALY